MQGWPEHMQDFPIKAGQEITVTSDQSATATATLLPMPHGPEPCSGLLFLHGRPGLHAPYKE